MSEQSIRDLQQKLEQAASNLTPDQRAAVERERNRLLPFDFLTWPPPKQLEFFASRWRLLADVIANSLAPMTPGTENWYARRDDPLVESSRISLLNALLDAWANGKLVSGSMIRDFYAFSILVAGKDRYATLAERETAYFLALLADKNGTTLLTFRSDKGVYESGFDGLFLGTLPSLGIGGPNDRFIGLEVKTVVDSKSLSQRIANMIHQWSNKANYRRQNLDHVLETLRRNKNPLAHRLAAIQPDQIATLLVIRSCTMGSSLNLPPGAGSLFDRVAAFNIFGDPIPSACVGVELSLLNSAVREYNKERTRHMLAALQRAGVSGIPASLQR